MPDEVVADAPGRVNLIGEHTDYHEGYVLPTIIPQRTRVTLRARRNSRVRARSAAIGGSWDEYELGGETAGRGWLDYIQGVTAAAAGRGLRLTGFELEVESDVPVGAGVSSSAALEVSLLRGLRQLFALELDDVTLAKIARAAETDFVGAPVGIMDQMVASLGRDRHALFLDTRTLAVEPIPLPASIELVVIDSGIAHAHAGGAYRERRQQSFEAAALLGVHWLRDVDTSMLDRIAALPPLLSRRARHVVTENARVLDAVKALERADFTALGALFAASQRSMREDYEITTPEIDALVALGAAHRHVFAARMTGGGFGGAVVMLARAGSGRDAAGEICAEYTQQIGAAPSILLPPP